jgi:hypothetical protein
MFVKIGAKIKIKKGPVRSTTALQATGRIDLAFETNYDIQNETDGAESL